MKSLAEINPNLNALVVKHPPRDAPLTDEKIFQTRDYLLEKGAVVEKKKFGQVPKKDVNGEVYGWEFVQTGVEVEYNPEKISQNIRDSLLRSCTPQTASFHIIKLAALVRDTRGPESMAVIATEVARELTNVSEWAVIEACRAYWTSGAIWYPAPGELLRLIREKDNALKAALEPRDQGVIESVLMKTARERLGKSIAQSWFSDCRLDGRVIMVRSRYRADRIKNDYLAYLKDIADDVQVETCSGN